MKRRLVVSGSMIPGVTLGSTLSLTAIVLAMKGERMNELRLSVPGEGRGGQVGVIITAIKKVYATKWVEKDGAVPKSRQLELEEKKGIVRVYVVRTQHNRLPVAQMGSRTEYTRDGFVFRFDANIVVEEGRGFNKGPKKNPVSKVFATKETITLTSGKRKKRDKPAKAA